MLFYGTIKVEQEQVNLTFEENKSLLLSVKLVTKGTIELLHFDSFLSVIVIFLLISMESLLFISNNTEFRT